MWLVGGCYNLVWRHCSLGEERTPAMAAGVTDRLWEVADVVSMIDAAAPKPGKRGPYKKRQAPAQNSN